MGNTKESLTTKYHIKEIYLNLMSKSNWNKITVKGICSAAYITRGTFYQYFNNIDDLMEQIQTPLLEELKSTYTKNYHPSQVITPSTFEERFDYNPPQAFIQWFDFCNKHKKRITILLGSNGDPFFLIKLKSILQDQLHLVMDQDGMPKDELREPFIKALLELHFLAVRYWLDTSNEASLSRDEIINLLNTMRVGASYLTYLNWKNK